MYRPRDPHGVLAVDGAQGEGGGQVVRLALALAAATGTPVVVERVRAHRPEPGLRPQHAACARALAELTDGEVEGAEVGSGRVALRPRVVVAGERAFAVGTAGSVTLLAQAILPAAAAARRPLAVRLEGGTDVRWAPTWDYFARVHVPLLAEVGVLVEPSLGRRGFFPVGGGQARLEVETPGLRRVELDGIGPVTRLEATIAAHGLPPHVVERAALRIEERLRDVRPVDVETDARRGPGVGLSVTVRAVGTRSLLGACAVGRKGRRVEDVVDEAVAPLRADLAAGVGVDVHQADQLPVFLALAGGGAFTARALTPHARTVLDLLPRFLPVACEVRREAQGVRVDVAAR